MLKEKVKGSPRPRYGLWLFFGVLIGILVAVSIFAALFEPRRDMVFTETAQLLSGEQVYTGLYSSDESVIYTQDASGNYYLWDALAEPVTPLLHIDQAYWHWNPQASLFLVSELGQPNPQLFDYRGNLMTTYEPGAATTVFWNPTGDHFLTASPSVLRLQSVDTSQVLAEFPIQLLSYESPYWSPDGSRFIVWSLQDSSSRIILYASDGTILTSLELKGSPNSVVWSDNSANFAMSYLPESSNDLQLLMYSRDGEELWSKDLNTDHGRLTWSSDSTVLVLIQDMPQGWMTFYSLTGEELNHVGATYAFRWNPTQPLLVSGGETNYSLLLRDKQGNIIANLVQDSYELTMTTPEWSPDGSMLASFGLNLGENLYSLYLWDSEGNLLHQMQSDSPMEYAYWSPDSSRILTTGGNVAQVWSALEGSEIASLNHSWSILSAQWNKDGSRILTVGSAPTTVAYENAIWTQDGEHIATLFTGSNTGLYITDWSDDFSQALVTETINGISVRELQPGSIYLDFRFDNE